MFRLGTYRLKKEINRVYMWIPQIILIFVEVIREITCSSNKITLDCAVDITEMYLFLYLMHYIEISLSCACLCFTVAECAHVCVYCRPKGHIQVCKTTDACRL